MSTISSEEVKYRGRLIEIIHHTYEGMPDGKIFEYARRGPGTRIIFDRGETILLTREYRFELEDYDWRVPGGKVFDSLVDYEAHRRAGHDDIATATATIIREAEEETGLRPNAVSYITKSVCGATIEWDLHYFSCTSWTENRVGQSLEVGEEIELHWVEKDKVFRMALGGQISEDRTALQLVRYLCGQDKPVSE